MVDKVGGVEFDVTIDSTGAVTAGSKIIQNNEKIEGFQDVDLAAKKSSGTIVKGSKDWQSNRREGSKCWYGWRTDSSTIRWTNQGGQSALLAFSQQGADWYVVNASSLVNCWRFVEVR